MQRGESELGLPEFRADLADGPAVEQACRGQQAVIHVAAKVSVVGDWSEFERVNVEGTQLLLRAARSTGVQRFVYVSSPSVAHAGDPIVGGTAEPANPDSARGHYARSKALAEIIALGANEPDFAALAIRPHLVWGPGDTQLIGRIAERARSGRLLLVGGGSALVDSTYIDNAVAALLAALDRAPGLGGQALVVTNGEPRTVAELLSRICLAMGAPPPTTSIPSAVATAAGSVVESVWGRLELSEEPPLTRFLAEQLATAHWFDQRRTREALQWKPHVSLAEGFLRLAEAHGQDE
jgi:nucleoside-diphosphate-sugar epimerase